MKPHIKAFLKFWNYTIADLNEITCWNCNSNDRVTIMHIDQKGMGGRESAEYIENYMPGCHTCHAKGEGNTSMKDVFWTKLVQRILAKNPMHKWSMYFKLTWFYKNNVSIAWCDDCQRKDCGVPEHIEIYNKLLTSNIR